MSYSFKENIDKIYKLLGEIEESYSDKFIREDIDRIDFQLDNIENRLVYLDSIGEAHGV